MNCTDTVLEHHRNTDTLVGTLLHYFYITYNIILIYTVKVLL
jgi:hypothetical protein